MKMSPNGIKLLMVDEGCRLKAYTCPKGVWTIGFGDTGPDVVQGLVISMSEAERRLAVRLDAEFEPGVEKALGKATVSQAQFDVLVGFAYNVGVQAFSKSTLVKLIKKGTPKDLVAAEFLKWTSGGLLLSRRKRDQSRYLKG